MTSHATMMKTGQRTCHSASHRSWRPFQPVKHAGRFSQRTVAVSSVATQPAKLAQVEALQKFMQEKSVPQPLLQPKRFITDNVERVGMIAARDLAEGEVVLEIPGSVAITAVDAAKHEVVGKVAAECEELVALTLWLLAERAKNGTSAWQPLLDTLPVATDSPLLWSEEERQSLLKGSPVGPESAAREQLLKEQWQQLQDSFFSKDTASFPPEQYSWEAFSRAFTVVLAYCTYLPTAECFALLPFTGLMRRTPNDNGCVIDFDIERKAVTVVTTRPYRDAQEVMVNEDRPNGELLLSTGTLLDESPYDCLQLPASLVPADRYYMMKEQILISMGMAAKEQFPIFADRMPVQLLAYVRLARVADPALFAKVSFDNDVLLTQMNEYEVLQLLMGDCRERLAAYNGNAEEEIKLLQTPNLTVRERLAARLRLGEKRILGQTMDGLRRKLAPIRGIPTKGGGMQDPNSDIKEIFDIIEDLPNAPKKFWNSLFGPADNQPR